jgi:DNA-binding transcriptional MerR regulator
MSASTVLASAEARFTITQLGQELRLTARAIRFYEDKGLIAPRRAGNARVYTPRDRARLMLIMRGKTLGFSLQEIKEYLDLYDTDPTHLDQLRLLLHRVQERIGLLEEQQSALTLSLRELRQVEAQTVSAIADKSSNSGG